MMILTSIAGTVILLGSCIFIHELGHLLGGKMVGIKAKVFSIGYGKGFWKKKVGDTTYQITLIPFGGYCQFYGDDPSEPRTGEGFEFLSAHPLKRIVTVAMGPVFNLIFGIILFFVMNLIGYTKESNKILIPNEMTSGDYISAAYKSGIRTGDRIISIDGKDVKAFSDIQVKAFFSDGSDSEIKVQRGDEIKTFTVKPSYHEDESRYTFGVMPYPEGVIISRVTTGSAAESSGLAKGDMIQKINGESGLIPSYITSEIQKGKEVTISFLRNGEEKNTTLKPVMTDIFVITTIKGKKRHTILGDEELKQHISNGTVRIDGKPISEYDELLKDMTNAAGSNSSITLNIDKDKYAGQVKVTNQYIAGIEQQGVLFENVYVKYGLAEGLFQSVVEPRDFLVMNIKGLAMMIKGKLSVRENLSGPIRIGEIAGYVLYYRGVADFILLIAKISVILMFMNLLPIPAVDGSHLIFYIIEIIRRKPIDEKIMARIQTFGILFLITLGVLVIINDISMLQFIQNIFD
ncbi:MAG: RIP metalloprotease RseP [Spirochaetes bacterium]|nr:RIP metalloprotease RseP [Spirochaetota bacterium]